MPQELNKLSSETPEMGTPGDYSSDLYRVYFEVAGHDLGAREIIADLIGNERALEMITLPHGYQVEMPIQCIPDVVRLLSQANIAIYQVARHEKVSGSW